MPTQAKLNDRYEIGKALGRGGMGVVYEAYDTLMRRHVALKTILDVDNKVITDLFYREWGVQAAIVHPNVVEIYDIGEFEENGEKRPFFVMPLLPGVGLDQLIAENSPRLTVERIVDVFAQACRGLQAAHERGLIHRDLKPSNIFVMDDDSVKIIDFGIAVAGETGAKTTLKGTLSYMAPEQLRMEPPTVRSDIFSMGVSCYETFAGARPFRGASDQEISWAILNQIPPAISEIKSSVNEAIGQVIHKSIAKDPWHRFGSARELGEALQKALRNEAHELFDVEKIKPRIERAAKAFEEGDHDFASEVLSEIEAEGHINPEIAFLRRRLDHAVRGKKIRTFLEQARRYKEAGEHNLALRRIQEALDLDPEDSDAQALRHEIEKERREKQIGEWLAVARRHLDNDAFGPARQAVGNILEVKTTDTAALRLQAEIDRRERELKRIREDKARLYEQAKNAFDRGDVSAALTKLEDLARMEDERPDTDRGGAYRQLYQRVRNEHDELRTAYDRARNLLGEDQYDEALKICDQWLSRYPSHALFQALRYDIEQRRRQSLSLFIADVDRRVDDESDLNRRVEILEKALEAYPGESHFEQALKLVRDKLELVNSIVTRARFHAEKGQPQEALQQWEILRSIHPEHPGLETAVEELQAALAEREEQVEKARLTARVDRLLENGDHDAALAAAEEALRAFPDDLALRELQKLAEKSREKTRAAGEFFAKGRDALDAGRVEEAIELLRQAHQTNDRDPVSRTMLVNCLVQQARRLMAENREQAERLVAEAVALDPHHEAARLIQERLADRQKEEFLAWTLGEARRLQGQDDLAGALALVRQGLATHPDEPRLKQLEATLARARERTSGDSKPALAAPEPSAVQAAPKSAPAESLEDAPTVVRPKTPRPGTPPPEARKKKAKTRPPAAPTGAKSPRKMLPLALGAGLGVGLLIIGAALFLGGDGAASAAVPVTIQTSPADASVLIDGEPCAGSPCRVELVAGSHRIEAERIGYQAAAQTIEIAPEAPPDGPFSLLLTPLEAALEITSNLDGAAVLLDGEEIGRLEQGQFRAEALPPGPHAVAVDDRGYRVEARIEVVPGEMPRLLEAPSARNLKAVVLAGLGDQATARWAGDADQPARLDGQEAGSPGPDGLRLRVSTRGPHELQVGPESESIAAYFDNGGARPMIVLSLLSDRNVGALVVEAGEDDATVVVNGTTMRGKTRRGRVIYTSLSPGIKRVTVQKEGFQPTPEQTVEITKGGRETLRFNLERLPQVASLRVRNGVPGAVVSVDGVKVGEVGPDGGFSYGAVKPGRRAVKIEKDLHEARAETLEFTDGETLEISGALQPTTGTIRLSITPAGVSDVRVTLKEGAGAARPISGTVAPVREGEFEVRASAPGHQEYYFGGRIARGETKPIAIELRPTAAPSQAPSTAREPSIAFSLDDLAKLPGWNKQGDYALRRGGGVSLLETPSRQGVYTFTAKLQSGRFEWVVDYQDDKNHVLYQVEKNELVRTRFKDGKKTAENKVAHGLDRDGFMTFQVDVSPGKIVVSAGRGQSYEKIDEYLVPADEDASSGRFGFNLPGRSQSAISFFGFYPR